jgi:hypothetical protein
VCALFADSSKGESLWARAKTRKNTLLLSHITTDKEQIKIAKEVELESSSAKKEENQ